MSHATNMNESFHPYNQEHVHGQMQGGVPCPHFMPCKRPLPWTGAVKKLFPLLCCRRQHKDLNHQTGLARDDYRWPCASLSFFVRVFSSSLSNSCHSNAHCLAQSTWYTGVSTTTTSTTTPFPETTTGNCVFVSLFVCAILMWFVGLMSFKRSLSCMQELLMCGTMVCPDHGGDRT